MAQLNQNLSAYDAMDSVEVLPPGEYRARISDSEIKQGPKGAYVKWTFDIIGKPNKIWDNMSIGNEISMKRLKTLATVTGHKNPNYIADTEELHGLECILKLKIEKDETGQYEPKNKIVAFKPINGTAPAMTNTQVQTEKKQEPGEKARMPWE